MVAKSVSDSVESGVDRTYAGREAGLSSDGRFARRADSKGVQGVRAARKDIGPSGTSVDTGRPPLRPSRQVGTATPQLAKLATGITRDGEPSTTRPGCPMTTTTG